MSPRGWIASTAMHAGLVLAAVIGLPQLWRDAPLRDAPVIVDLMVMADETAAPAPEPETEPEPEPEEAAEPAPPEPEPAPPEISEPLPQPDPDPEPVPEPETAEAPVEPAPAPVPVPQTKPKAPPQRSFAMVEESLLLDREHRESAPAAETADVTFEQVGTSLEDLHQASVSDEATAAMTAIVGQQIARRWNIQSGAAGAQALVVTIEVVLSADARVRSARITDVQGGASDDIRRAAAESARRAVLYFRDHPFLHLELDRYNEWRHMIIRFDPSQMLRT